MTLTIDEKNDITLGENGNINTVTGIQEVLQNCQTAVQLIAGEAIYRSSDGTPAFETLWNGSPNFQQAEASIRAIILRVVGVTNINSFDYVANNNIFSYNVEIETVFGTEILEGGLNV